MQLLANTTSPYVRIARVSLIEKGINIVPTIVDPWADDQRLRDANAATRVPALILDDGTALTESLLIVQWLEQTRPAPEYPSLIGPDASGVFARAGIALGVIDASVHTIIIRKVTAPVLFDETPVGLRRRRTMAEGMQRLESIESRASMAEDGIPRLDAICAVTALDYLNFRFSGETWMPPMPALNALSDRLRSRASFAGTMPYTLG
jgi:glutathione S-transferase